MSTDRLRERARKRGWSAEKLQAKIRRRETVRSVGRSLLSPVLRPALEAVASVVPGGALALRAVAAVVDSAPEAVADMPVLADVAVVGRTVWDEHVAAAGDPLRAVWRDLVPVLREIEDGQYGRAALYVAVVGAAVAALILI